jgi:hypothetical protein
VSAPLDESALAELLPGSWRLAATNSPRWLSGKRSAPKFSYSVVEGSPLVIASDVAYRNPTGEEKHVRGTNSYRSDHFLWRGEGLLSLISRRWTAARSNSDPSVLATRFATSLMESGGIDILVREDVDIEVRALVAGASEQFGLTPENFASLSWLSEASPR